MKRRALGTFRPAEIVLRAPLDIVRRDAGRGGRELMREWLWGSLPSALFEARLSTTFY